MTTKFKEGQTIVFSSGEYDDYEIWLCVALRDFDLEQEVVGNKT